MVRERMKIEYPTKSLKVSNINAAMSEEKVNKVKDVMITISHFLGIELLFKLNL